MSASDWCSCLRKGTGSEPVLYMFPHAGSGGSFYRLIAGGLPVPVEVYSVDLPGRERRIAIPPLRRMDAVIAALMTAISVPEDRPTLFLGHSFGALVAFELVRNLAAVGRRCPAGLVLSGRSAPGRKARRPDTHMLSDAELIEELRHYNGTDQRILDNAEFMELLLPTLRADLEINNTTPATQPLPLPCAIACVAGREDPDVTPEDLLDWRPWAGRDFRSEIVPGGHFFLFSSARFREILCEEIDRL